MSEPTSDEVRVLEAAGRARSELEATEDAFDTIRRSILDEIATTKLGESQLRELLYMSVQALDAVRQKLRMVAASDALVQHNVTMRELLGEIEE
jgi:hypothetical protein